MGLTIANKVQLRCKLHPNYMGLRGPSTVTNCEACWIIFNTVQDGYVEVPTRTAAMAGSSTLQIFVRKGNRWIPLSTFIAKGLYQHLKKSNPKGLIIKP